MPLPEEEFRRRLRKVTGEFARLLGNRELIDSAPAELRLYVQTPIIHELWSAFVSERIEIAFTNTASGEMRPSNDAASGGLTESTLWPGISLFQNNPLEVTTKPAR